jgi:hypothetical protein
MKTAYALEKATAALAEAGNFDDASALIVSWARSDNALTDDLIAIGARHIVQAVASTDRRRVQVIARPDDTAGLRAAANRTFLDTYRIGGENGKPLGDGTREDLIRAANLHEAMAIGNKREATFLRLIAEAMGKAAKVRDALTEKKALELKAKAEKAANPYGESNAA